MRKIYTKRKLVFDEKRCVPTYNTTNQIGELSGRERSQITTSYSQPKVIGFPECPISGLKYMDYKKGKRAYIMKNLDPELVEALKNDKLYGKSTLVHSVFPSKDDEGNETGRMVSVDMVYFGIAWLRMQKICELWGVELHAIE